MPPRAAALADIAPDQRMLVLEQKLSILSLGPSSRRRNPALDVLTGRVPDERLHGLQASLLGSRGRSVVSGADGGAAAPVASQPTAMVLPVAAIRMAAVASGSAPAPSPWLATAPGEPRARLRLISPPPPPWSRLVIIGPLILWFTAASRPYTYSARSPRARPAS